MADKKKEKPTPAQHTIDAGPSRSMFGKAVSRAFTPLTDAPSRMARDFTSAIDTTPTENPLLARLKGFGMGAIEGAGDVVSDMTSPVSLASMALPAAAQGIGALRRAGQAGNVARQAAMPRINPRPDPITTIDLGPSDFRNADEVFEHYANKVNPNRGTFADVPDNPVARRLEMERRAIERRGIPRTENAPTSKALDNIIAGERRKQIRRVK